MRTTPLLLLLFVSTQVMGQRVLRDNTIRDETTVSWNKITRPLGIYFVCGAQYNDNRRLRQWLEANGSSSSSRAAYSYGAQMILPSKYFIWEAGLINTQMRSPNQSDFDFHLSAGKMFQRRNLYVAPFVGLGFMTSEIKFTGQPVPAALSSLNITDGKLFQNYAEVVPKVVVLQRLSSMYMVGLEVGCRSYFRVQDWKYVGSNGRTSVPEIPSLSVFHPYCSIYLGIQIDHMTR